MRREVVRGSSHVLHCKRGEGRGGGGVERDRWMGGWGPRPKVAVGVVGCVSFVGGVFRGWLLWIIAALCLPCLVASPPYPGVVSR